MRTKYWVKHLSGTVVFLSIPFISAGRIDYWQGLLYFFIGLIMFVLSYTILRIDPSLMKERAKPGESAKKWDKSLLGATFLVSIAMYIIAGLDSGRYQWSPEFHPGLYLLGIILTASGQLLFLVAQKQNSFFSSTVRIQSDRGHRVIETGVYQFVRHPGYLGSIIQALGFPLVFGSIWSIIPSCASMVLFLLRTYLEDKTLKEELPGYIEYSAKTRYRIMPYIW